MKPKLYDKLGTTLLGELNLIEEAYVIEERNGLFELEFVIYLDDSLFSSVEEETIILCNANDKLLNQKFRIYKTNKLMDNCMQVYARHISFDLAYDLIENVSLDNASCEYALNTLFRSSQFSRHYKGYSNIVNAQDYKMNMANILEAIAGKEGSIIDTFGTGAEILRDNENIHVLNRRGNDNLVSIEYAKNLTGFELEEDTTDLVTRIIPYASYTNSETNEEIIVKANAVDSPLILNYSHPYISYKDYSDKFQDGEVPTTEKLIKFANDDFTNNNIDKPKQNFKIEFIPLSQCVGYEGLEDKISLCDIVTIKDTRYNINTKAKVIRTVFDVLKNRYDSMELGEPRTTLGDVIGGGSGEKGEPGPPGPQGPPGADGSIGDFPNSLPTTPILSSKLYGFSSIELSWTFENKVYYQYELYASKTKDFVPNVFDIVHQGQTSSFLFQAKPNETWYFRVCCINSHGNRTDFSNQIMVTTKKVDDLSNYFEEAAIGNAVVGALTSDYIQAGTIKGSWIDAKNLSVTDGNGKRTLDIDTFGNVVIDASNLKLRNEDIGNKINELEQTAEGFEFKISETGGKNYIRNSQFKHSSKFWYTYQCTLVNAGNVPTWLNKFNRGTGVGIKNTSTWEEATLYTENIAIETNNYYSLSMDGYVMSNVKSAELWIEEKRADGSIIYSHFVGHIKNDQRFGGTIHVTNGEAKYLTVVVKHLGVKVEGEGNDVVYVDNFKLEQGEHITNHSQHPEEIYANNVIIDKDGLTIYNKNGAMVNMGSEEFSFTDDTGNKSLGVNGGGFTFHTTNLPEYVGFIKPITMLPDDNRFNGIALANTEIGDFIAIGHDAQINESVTDFKHDILIVNRDIEGIGDNVAGIYLYNLPLIVKSDSYFDKQVTMQDQTVFNRQLVVRSNEEGLPHVIHTHNEDMALYGHRGVSLGVRDNDQFYKGLRLVYAGDYSNKCYIYIDADMNFNGYYIYNANLYNCNIHNSYSLDDEVALSMVEDGYATIDNNSNTIKVENSNLTKELYLENKTLKGQQLEQDEQIIENAFMIANLELGGI